MTQDEYESSSIRAAVEQEHRFTRLEAKADSMHASIDALHAVIGELRGYIAGRLDRVDERVDNLEDGFASHIQQGQDRRLYPRLDALEVSVHELADKDGKDAAAATATKALWKSQWAVLAAGIAMGAAIFEALNKVGWIG